MIATEVAKASVAAACYNKEANNAANVHVARLSSEEFVQAWRGEREFYRMQGLPKVKGRKFQTLLVSFHSDTKLREHIISMPALKLSICNGDKSVGCPCTADWQAYEREGRVLIVSSLLLPAVPVQNWTVQ